MLMCTCSLYQPFDQIRDEATILNTESWLSATTIHELELGPPTMIVILRRSRTPF